MGELAERLVHAVGFDRPYAGVLTSTAYAPAGGDKVFPPSFPGEPPQYLFEERPDPDGSLRPVVILDQVPSQANRIEAAMLRARDDERIALPLFDLRTQASDGLDVRLTSLEFPHRASDAYLRDAKYREEVFDDSPPGRRLRSVTASDLSALYELSPESLLFGVWDSHRKGRGIKVARSYSSSVVGFDPVAGERRAGRMDPLNLSGDITQDGDTWKHLVPGEGRAARQNDRVSKVGHGNIMPSTTHGGVTISGARRQGWLSLAALDNLRLGTVSPEAARLAKAALAALALAGDRLAFAGPSLWLRSGCDLVRTEQRVVFVSPEGEEPLEIGTAEALEAFAELRERAAEAGLAMSTDTYPLEPQSNLAQAIDFSLTRAEPNAGD